MTTTMKEAAAEFLSKKRIAVAGVSRESGGAHGGNPVYVRLRDRGYEVFAVNPNATEVEGDASRRRLRVLIPSMPAIRTSRSTSS